jgi:hypothetical protein
MDRWTSLTCAGETSGIMTNGTGPRPTANDLNLLTSVENITRSGMTYMTKVMIATLDNATMPLFKPMPTNDKDTRAPKMDMESSRLRPKR